MARPSTKYKKYTCICCGAELVETDFITSRKSNFWKEVGGRVLMCKNCLNKLYEELVKRYESPKAALMIMCAYTGVPFSEQVMNTCVKQGDKVVPFTFVRYTGRLGIKVNADGFEQYIVDICRQKPVETYDAQNPEKGLTKSDRQNRTYIMSVIGYDPFEDDAALTIKDRKFCYNILSTYLDSPGVAGDGHKIQSVIQMSYLQLQVHRIDIMIGEQLSKPDQAAVVGVAKLIETKDKLLSSVSKLCKDNNISSAYSKEDSAGQNTFSKKMKELDEMGIEEIKTNFFDVKTSEMFLELANISNQSIMTQLNLDSNEYAQIVKDQRKAIGDLTTKCDALEEENRKLKNQILLSGGEV